MDECQEAWQGFILLYIKNVRGVFMKVVHFVDFVILRKMMTIVILAIKNIGVIYWLICLLACYSVIYLQKPLYHCQVCYWNRVCLFVCLTEYEDVSSCASGIKTRVCLFLEICSFTIRNCNTNKLEGKLDTAKLFSLHFSVWFTLGLM